MRVSRENHFNWVVAVSLRALTRGLLQKRVRGGEDPGETEHDITRM